MPLPQRRAPFARVPALLFASTIAACGGGEPGGGTGAITTSAEASANNTGATTASATVRGPERVRLAPNVREGGAIARGVERDVLWLADEDHGVLRRFTLPLTEQHTSIDLPGRPANVLPLDGKVLVTLRDPGLLMVIGTEGESPREQARIVVPPDAWGLAISPDERIALVTSAWAHAVTAVDLATNKVLWSIDVGREPRGVTITPDGKTAYVSHLTGDRVTHIDAIDGTPAVRTLKLERAKFVSAKERDPAVPPPSGALAYSAILSPDGSRLFIARHSSVGLGPGEWFGTPTVDVVSTRTDTFLLPPAPPAVGSAQWTPPDLGAQALGPGLPSFVVPRHVVYRRRTRTLLLASEATDAIVETDALSLQPGAVPLRTYRTGRHYEEQIRAAREGGAPTAIALSADEETAYVFCRATYDIVSVPLDGDREKSAGSTAAAAPEKGAEARITRVAADPFGPEVSIGRRLFYTAMSPELTDAVSCATCHPEGRDDGETWIEIEERFLAFPQIQGWRVQGAARQTPMLAGRVNAEGPYGWRGESPNLKSRIIAGFGLHRWTEQNIPRSAEVRRESTAPGDPILKHPADYLVAFLRRGLVTPPALHVAPPGVIARGRQLFEDPRTGCAGCHAEATDFTNRVAVAFPPSPKQPLWVNEEPKTAYKTPSLLFVGGTPPYYHDGSADTLEDLLDKNANRMGKTAHLSGEDRGALAAYLRSIGAGSAPEEAYPKVTVAAAAAPAPVPPKDTLPKLSPQPHITEWKDAPPFALTRAREGCTAQKIREYVRVACLGAEMPTVLTAGFVPGVSIWGGELDKRLFVVFPLTQGDRRVITGFRDDWVSKYGSVTRPALLISVTWLPGEDPIVVVD